MTADYQPTLPNPLRPPIPDLTNLKDWKKATSVVGFRSNALLVAIDQAIIEYHKSDRLWHKYIQLDQISQNASQWSRDKADKKKSARRDAMAKIITHALALRRYPTLEPINEVVYRGSKRSPAEIFQAGFETQKKNPPISIGEDGHTWEDGAESKSQVVSTALNVAVPISHYAQGGWLYALHAAEGIDLRENGDSEIAVLGVPNTDIIGAIGRVASNQMITGQMSNTMAYVQGPINMVAGEQSNYFENPNCTVAAATARIPKLWLKRLAGEDLDDQERSDLANWVRRE